MTISTPHQATLPTLTPGDSSEATALAQLAEEAEGLLAGVKTLAALVLGRGVRIDHAANKKGVLAG